MDNKTTVFEVMAVEYFQKDKDGNTKSPVIHHFRKPTISTTKSAVKDEIKFGLMAGMKPEDIAGFSDRLQIDVSVPFPQN